MKKNINIFLGTEDTATFRAWLDKAKLELPVNKIYREIIKHGVKAVSVKYKLEGMSDATD